MASRGTEHNKEKTQDLWFPLSNGYFPHAQWVMVKQQTRMESTVTWQALFLAASLRFHGPANPHPPQKRVLFALLFLYLIPPCHTKREGILEGRGRWGLQGSCIPLHVSSVYTVQTVWLQGNIFRQGVLPFVFLSLSWEVTHFFFPSFFLLA